MLRSPENLGVQEFFIRNRGALTLASRINETAERRRQEVLVFTARQHAIEQAQQLTYLQPVQVATTPELTTMPVANARTSFKEILKDPATIAGSVAAVPVVLGVKAICDYLLSIPNMEVYAMRGTFLGAAVLATATIAFNAAEVLKPNNKPSEAA